METKSKVINDITTSCVLESLSYKPKATAKLRTDLPKQAFLQQQPGKRSSTEKLNPAPPWHEGQPSALVGFSDATVRSVRGGTFEG